MESDVASGFGESRKPDFRMLAFGVLESNFSRGERVVAWRAEERGE